MGGFPLASFRGGPGAALRMKVISMNRLRASARVRSRLARKLLPAAMLAAFAGLAAASLGGGAGAAAPKPTPAASAAIASKPTADPADSLPWPEARPIKKVAVGNAPIVTSFGKFVYFAGQPGPEDLALFKQKGVKTVINLRAPAEMKFDEKAEVEKLGLQYLQSPVGHTEAPTAGEFERVAAALDKAGKGEPVLLHCASSNRVGFMWGLYRAKRHGLSPEAALAEGKAAGLKAPPLVALLRKELGLPPSAAPVASSSAPAPASSASPANGAKPAKPKPAEPKPAESKAK